MLPTMRQGKYSLQPFLDWLPLEKVSVLEVGCFAGEGTLAFLQSEKVYSVTCVDPFKSGYDPTDKASHCDMTEVKRAWADRVLCSGIEKPVALFSGLNVHGMLSSRFDLCYVDGNHKEDYVFDDVVCCLTRFDPKIIAGHDYGVDAHPGVKAAVDRLFPKDEIHTFPDYSWAVIR